MEHLTYHKSFSCHVLVWVCLSVSKSSRKAKLRKEEPIDNSLSSRHGDRWFLPNCPEIHVTILCFGILLWMLLDFKHMFKMPNCQSCAVDEPFQLNDLQKVIVFHKHETPGLFCPSGDLKSQPKEIDAKKTPSSQKWTSQLESGSFSPLHLYKNQARHSKTTKKGPLWQSTVWWHASDQHCAPGPASESCQRWVVS